MRVGRLALGLVFVLGCAKGGALAGLLDGEDEDGGPGAHEPAVDAGSSPGSGGAAGRVGVGGAGGEAGAGGAAGRAPDAAVPPPDAAPDAARPDAAPVPDGPVADAPPPPDAFVPPDGFPSVPDGWAPSFCQRNDQCPAGQCCWGTPFAGLACIPGMAVLDACIPSSGP